MTIQQPNSFRTGPDERGHFGLRDWAYNAATNKPAFKKEMDGYLKDYVERPLTLYFAERLTAELGRAWLHLERGHFGLYGGRFVAETLMPLILDLERAYNAAKNDPAFKKEMDGYLKDYVGRPSPLYFAERLTAQFGGAKIYLKREDLNHTGAH